MGAITYIIYFLILLSIVVSIHEYGHYYFAKRFGVGVTVFSIGMGKELFGWTDKSGTRWKFSALPLGGYVKFFGDHNIFSDYNREELRKKYNKEDQKKLLAFKPLYQRNLIAFGGPLANFILAFFILLFVFMFVGKDFTPAKINKIQTESPAEKYGLKQNDILLNIDGNKVESILDVPKFIMLSNNEFIDFVVLRSGDEYLLKVKPNKINTKDDLGNLIQKRIVGIEIGKNGDINHVKLGLVKAAYYSLNEIIFLSKKTLSMIWGFIQKIWGKGYGDLNQLGGPIKIAQITGEVAKMGVLPLIMLISFISISLGLVNLLPIPLLDGGHIMLNTIEWIRGKEFNRTTLDFAFRIGLFSLASLIIFTTLNDIRQLLAF
jgi:regulator of sigma E protease|tara:strand:+ start:96 stop:1223 length:1128 start_codon:yes stop_codon:yes gene_type:complete